LRIARPHALFVIVALAAIACSNPSSGPAASGSRVSSPSQGVGVRADSKAADLRARLDLLLGEHVTVIAKDSLAATANRADEYAGYATLLTINGNDLSAVMNSAFGASAAARFDQIWATQNTYFVDYTIGIASHDSGKSDGAASGLVNGFVPAFAQFMNSMASIPLDPITQLTTEQVLEIKAIVDDQAALNNARMFADLHRAYTHAARLGDALAPAIASKFPDKFPGDPADKAVDFRVSLDTLLQEHAYLATMTTSAATGGRSTEQAAALTAVAANADSLGTLFSSVWGARDAELIVYAGNGDDATRQAALNSLTNSFVTQFLSLVRDSTDLSGAEISNAVQSQIADMIRVIDDQRAKSAKVVAADDHTAAAATNPIGDLIATAAVAKLPSKF
jgi:hypothetical protein